MNTPFTNALIHESSPYLLQHAHNPVNWEPWGEAALKKAKSENKPLIISIGYAACHWCHVMEHESFSDPEVAEYMNTHFVSIKVDREERPDVDQVYMDAAMLISQRGGWPLNAFAMPDGRPFYAATYFPKSDWMDLLRQVVNLYTTEYVELAEQAKNLTQGINRHEFNPITVSKSLSKESYQSLFNLWQPLMDNSSGGWGQAPKFPMPVGWELILQYLSLYPNNLAAKALNHTLERMALGGIYDQIGGGFARYSVDAHWKVPHFEKMLYDNGQLVSLYAHAYQLNSNTLYKKVIRETLCFVERELLSPENGFYSSLNADSEGVEGKFYVWEYPEFMGALPPEISSNMAAYFQVTLQGNWEKGANILYCEFPEEQFAKYTDLEADHFSAQLAQAKQYLLQARNQRERPSTDDKILTSWNALMLKGYADAYLALGDDQYLQTALRNAQFISKHLFRADGGLWRNFKNGKASITAFLDDYAFLAQALIRLYEATFDVQWLHKARNLCEYVMAHFTHSESPLFFYTDNTSATLVAKKIEIPDNVIPSSNSVMAKNLHLLGLYFDIPEYKQRSDAMLQQVLDDIPKGGPYYGQWAQLLGMNVCPQVEVAIVGPNALTLNQQLQKHHYPLASFCGGTSDNLPLLKGKQVANKTLIYICINKACLLPVETVDDAIRLLTQAKPI